MVLNNILLVVATMTVFLGTFYPLIIETFSNTKISVGAPYFDRTFAPIMIVLIGFMGVGPLVKWREDSWANIRPHVLKSGLLISLIALMVYIYGKSALGAISMGFAAYLAFSTFVAFGRKIGFGKAGMARRLRAQPSAVYGFFLAHMGMAITMAGVVSMSVWLKDDVKILKIGESMQVGRYEFTLNAMVPGQAENFQFLKGEIQVMKDGKSAGVLYSARRFYPVREMITSEAGIKVGFMKNIYVGVGDGDLEKGWVLRAYIHPMVCWIWLGALMMALAGMVSLIGPRSRAKQGKLS